VGSKSALSHTQNHFKSIPVQLTDVATADTEHSYTTYTNPSYLICPIIFDCGNRGSIEISSTLVMISSYSKH